MENWSREIETEVIFTILGLCLLSELLQLFCFSLIFLLWANGFLLSFYEELKFSDKLDSKKMWDNFQIILDLMEIFVLKQAATAIVLKKCMKYDPILEILAKINVEDKSNF